MGMKKFALVLFALFAGFVFAEENADAKPSDVKAEAPKRRPKKLAEYSNWEQAAAVAEAWEQPILAFVEVAGDSDAAKLRGLTVEMRMPVDFKKEFLAKNMVYYHAKVPKVKEKRPQNGNNNQKRVKTPPKPDFVEMKTEERIAVQRLLGGNNGSLPAIVVADAGGQVIASLGSFAPESLGSFVDDLKSAMESKKYTVELSPKLERALEKEKKLKEKNKK